MLGLSPMENAVLAAILAIFVACFVFERVKPGWPLPRVRSWPLRVLAINAVQLAFLVLVGMSWERWLAPHALFHLGSQWNPLAGAALAYFIATFVFYWWHRLRHEHDVLWLGFHQIHHSARRLEVVTSFYKHPAEMLADFLIGSVLAFSILGLSVHGAALYTLFSAIGEFFYHANIKTPHWVGYFFQRPEMHRIHHRHGVHKNNYGDIVWWDMLFGTYENPREWEHQCGFDADKEEQLMSMLVFRDVHR